MRLIGGNGALAVERQSQRADDAADHRFADRRGHDRARALDRIAFLNQRVFAQQHGADLIFFEVERDAEHIVRKRQHFAGHRLFQAVDARDAVAHGNHRADFFHGDSLLVIGDLRLQNLCDFIRFDRSHSRSYSEIIRARRRSSCARTDPS